MTIKNRFAKRIMAIILALAIFVATLPTFVTMAAVGGTEEYYRRSVDQNTMDNWKNYFSLTDISTENAGGVWTDKSVFTDASAFNGKITMNDSEKNFLTALSAIAANKEVVGYSTVPTDTIFVLDLSTSMEDGDVRNLVNATNDAIAQLQSENSNNRVGVVLYSGNMTYSTSVTRLLPLDRYTTTRNDGDFIRYQSSTVSVYNEVSGTKSFTRTSRRTGEYTYIQAGLWEAWKMFEEVPDNDIYIGNDNWQSGEYRMPIVVLMTDGAPTNGTVVFDNVGNGDFGSNYPYNLHAGDSFFVQLTASYIKNQIENKYKVKEEYGAGRSLFYTLGFNISSQNANTENDNSIAYSVVNPDGSTITDSYWEAYNRSSSVQVTVTGNRNGSSKQVRATKNSYATSKSYVDEYFPASGNGLSAAFDDIVEEILIQSRYYPTHLEGGSPDFSGYIEFTDVIGEYMEIKDIKGILLGDVLFDGHMMASKIADTSEGGLGTVENPTLLGNEFIRAVRTRLGIANSADAQALVAQAFAAGQLKYNSASDWSNYVGWYAKADGTYAGFYNEGTTTAPADAVYINKSYGFLGETSGSIKNSDMMYMSVQIRENISTGQQTLLWKIPAALVPLITYAVSLEGTNVDNAKNVNIVVENIDSVAPIRLIYESGLRSDLNELNITRITDQKHIGADGVTRRFWNNYFDISAPDHESHVTTMSEFTPSKENERFYYTFDSAVLKKEGNGYLLVGEDEGNNGALDTNAEYYHRRYIFTDDSSTPIFTYEKMSAKSIAAAKWDSQYETLDHNTGAWVVPKGTPARELSMYSADKNSNPTDSAHMIFYPYLTEQNNTFYVDMNLGNNGLLEITPAQGLKISKTIDVYEQGTSEVFNFRITATDASGTPLNGNFNTYLEEINVTPTVAPTEKAFTNGVMEVTISADETFWIAGLPTGTVYNVEEIKDNADYKLKSIHVNGRAMSGFAAGSVAANLVDDVHFVNTAVGEGDLVITKQVVDKNGNTVVINEDVNFTAEVTLTDLEGEPVSGRFETSSGSLTVPANGKFTVTLSAGDSFVVRGLTEGTNYSVRETNIPEGFTLDTAKSNLSGVVDASANDQALILNTYTPTAANGDGINVTVSKVISGNRTDWVAGESYTFVLEQGGRQIATKTISAADTDKTALFTLSSETYSEAGTYNYRIYEQKGNQGGITYDSTDRRFSVTVADSDMDGDLEVVSVTNLAGTSVSGRYNVSATFTNTYAPEGTATVDISIVKKMNGNHRLDGYRFALYDADPRNSSEENEVVRSTATNSAGSAVINLTYTADVATVSGKEYNYWLAEIDAGDPNISYDTRVYPVTVTVYDNKNGTVSAVLTVSNLPTGETNPVFENTYVPSASDFVTISGTKEISGDRALNNGEFSFKLEAETTGAPLPATTTVKNEADGSFSFGAIEFTDTHKGQNFVYVITEDGTNKIGGFTYDSAVFKVYVSVVDNGDATLTANITEIEKINGSTTTVSDVKFVNEYDAVDAEITLSGTKLLTGKTLQNGEFTFKLSAVTAGAPMPSSATVTNDAQGNIRFDKITYAKAGVYVYTLSEVASADSRYDFDESVYTVTVTVTDNSVGRLLASVKLTKDGLNSSEIVFRNGFVPEAIGFDIYDEFGGNKTLEGRPLRDGEFEFMLINAINGEQIGSSVRNDASGKFAFPEVKLPAAGIYHFKITEKVGDEVAVSYDTSSFHVRLEVVQNTDGTLEIVDKRLYKGTVTKEEVGGVLTEVTNYENITGNGAIEFVNLYTPNFATVTLQGTKTLEGRELVDGEFKFDLHETDSSFDYDETTLLEDDVALVLQDDGSGLITFTDLVFDAEGEYYFVILEDELDEKGITTDKNVYEVKITVTDNLLGQLMAKVYVNETEVSGEISETVVFKNLYETEAVDIIIKATKVYKKGTLTDDLFSFGLYDAEGRLLETVKNKGAEVTFSAIGTDKAGTYTFTVKEIAGESDEVIYDNTVYTVKVILTDNLDGTLSAEYIYYVGENETEDVTFVNEFVPVTEIPKTGDTLNLGGWMAVLFISTTALASLVIYDKKRRKV